MYVCVLACCFSALLSSIGVQGVKISFDVLFGSAFLSFWIYSFSASPSSCHLLVAGMCTGDTSYVSGSSYPITRMVEGWSHSFRGTQIRRDGSSHDKHRSRRVYNMTETRRYSSTPSIITPTRHLVTVASSSSYENLTMSYRLPGADCMLHCGTAALLHA